MVDVTGSTVASPLVEDSRQTSMWNITSSWEKAASKNPLFASLKGNPFKDSPLAESEQPETTCTCSIDDERCVFTHIFVNIAVFLYNITVCKLNTCR